MKSRLIGQKAMNHILKGKPVVQEALEDQAKTIESAATYIRALHYVTGDATIERSQGSIDHFVSLVDPAAVSIEYGHWYRNSAGEDKYVPGLYIITRAAGLI